MRYFPKFRIHDRVAYVDERGERFVGVVDLFQRATVYARPNDPEERGVETWKYLVKFYDDESRGYFEAWCLEEELGRLP